MRSVFIVLLVLPFLFGKCKKENIDNGIYFGYAKATINGVGWSAKARGLYPINNSDSLILEFEKWNGLTLIDNIVFNKISKAVSRHKLYFTDARSGINKSTSNYYTLRDDGDVLCDVYNVMESDSLINNITITSYNDYTKEIKGTFDVTYIIDNLRAKCRASAPDTIRVRNGEFHTKIF